jgi:hypothetical protein
MALSRKGVDCDKGGGVNGVCAMGIGLGGIMAETVGGGGGGAAFFLASSSLPWGITILGKEFRIRCPDTCQTYPFDPHVELFVEVELIIIA